jgi:anti-sigma B factor antagonist
VPHDRDLTLTLQSRSQRPHVLVVAGDLDHHTAPRMRAVLDGITMAEGDALVLDLTGLTFCDSTGVSILIAAHQRVHDARASLALAGLHDDIAHVFRIMGLDRLFTSYASVEKAVAALR